MRKHPVQLLERLFSFVVEVGSGRIHVLDGIRKVTKVDLAIKSRRDGLVRVLDPAERRVSIRVSRRGRDDGSLFQVFLHRVRVTYQVKRQHDAVDHAQSHEAKDLRVNDSVSIVEQSSGRSAHLASRNVLVEARVPVLGLPSVRVCSERDQRVGFGMECLQSSP